MQYKFFKNIAFCSAIALLIFAKFIIFSGNETITEGSDSLEYLLYAEKWFWGYETIPIRGPVFPLWIALVHAINIPLRFASEIMFIFSALFFSLSLMRIQIPRFVITIIFAIIIFYPGINMVLDMAMSEGLFVTVLLFSMATSILFLTTRSIKKKMFFSILMGLTCAGLIQTRQIDSLLIYFLISQTILLDLIFLKWHSLRRRRVYNLKIVLIYYFSIVVTILIINLIVFSLNYLNYSQFSYNKIVAPEKSRLFNVLIKIDTGEKLLHPRIPITTAARLEAYKLSPTFLKYKNKIEEFCHIASDSNFNTFSRTGIKNQMDVEDTLSFFTFMNPLTLRKISYEIEEGLRNNKVKSKYAFGMMTLSREIILTHIPNSIKKIFSNFMHTNQPPIKDNYPFYGSLFSPIYNRMAARRLNLITKGPMEMVFALFNNADIESIEFVNNTYDYFFGAGAADPCDIPLYKALYKMYIENCPTMPQTNSKYIYFHMGDAIIEHLDKDDNRSDIFNKLQNINNYNFYSITIPAVNDRVHLFFMKFILTLKNGKKIEIPNLEATRLITNKEIKSNKGNDIPYSYFILSFPLQLTVLQEFGYEIQNNIFNIYNMWTKYLTYFVLLIGSVLIIRNIFYKIKFGVFLKLRLVNTLIITNLLVIILCRVFYYAAVDTVIFPINIDRHLLASSILYIPILVIILYKCLLSLVRMR